MQDLNCMSDMQQVIKLCWWVYHMSKIQSNKSDT